MKKTLTMPLIEEILESAKDYMNNQDENKNTNNYTNILVTKRMRDWIAYNYKMEQDVADKIFKIYSFNTNVKQAIINSPLAWKRNKLSTCVAIDLFVYLVVAVSDNKPVIIDVCDLHNSSNNQTVIDIMVKDYNDQRKQDGLGSVSTMIEDNLMENIGKIWEQSQENGISTALIQRCLSCGYARASQIMDDLEMYRVIPKRNSAEKLRIRCDFGEYLHYMLKACEHK